MHRGWGVAALCALWAMGCDDGVETPDAAMDAAAADAGEGTPVCRASDVPGCHETCQFFYDCAVSSSLADRIEEVIVGLGFSGDGYMDCGGCIDQCEAATESEAALACFTAQAAAASCAPGAGDPTVAANSVNVCCEGDLESTFCQSTCQVTAGLAEFFPMCAPFLLAARPPTCIGSCPAVTEALRIPVDAAGPFGMLSGAIADDGTFALLGLYEDGRVDLGSGPLPAPDSGGAVLFAVYDGAGNLKAATRLSQGYPFPIQGHVRPTFQDLVAFDDARNVYHLTTARGEVDLGSGAMSGAGMSDLLLASYTEDGVLRWAQLLGGPGEEEVGELRVLGGEVTFTAAFSADADFGGGALPVAGGRDAVVVRYDTDGNYVWARPLGSAGHDDIALALAVHPSGEYTLAGGVGGGADLGAGAVTAIGGGDSFIARYAADGTLLWSDLRGGTTNDFAYEIASRGEDVVLADYLGSADAMATYGSSMTSGTSWTTAGYSAAGDVTWARHFTVEGMNVAVTYAMEIDDSGRLATTRAVSTGTDLGGGPHTDVGGGDIAVVTHDAAGAHRWSLRMGTPGVDPPPLLHRLASGELMVAGTLVGTLDYGSGELTAMGQDLYIMRFAAE